MLDARRRAHRCASGRLRARRSRARAARRFAKRAANRRAPPRSCGSPPTRAGVSPAKRFRSTAAPGPRIASATTSGFPLGVVAAITPFNDPLAIVAHKVGPALAAGNAVVLKPSSATPLSALRLAAGLPERRPAARTTQRRHRLGQRLSATRSSPHPRVRMVTFTGGAATGERISRIAGIKKLSMELGSNSPVIVLPDANLDRAVPAIAAGAFAQAGQNCLGVQRVFVHDAIYDTFKTPVRRACRAAERLGAHSTKRSMSAR